MQHRVLRELLRPGAPNLISRQGNVSKRKQGSVLEEHGGALCKNVTVMTQKGETATQGTTEDWIATSMEHAWDIAGTNGSWMRAPPHRDGLPLGAVWGRSCPLLSREGVQCARPACTAHRVRVCACLSVPAGPGEGWGTGAEGQGLFTVYLTQKLRQALTKG